MTRNSQPETTDNSAWLVAEVSHIRKEAEKKSNNHVVSWIKDKLRRLTEQSSEGVDTYAGELGDPDIVQALFTLMPQIQARTDLKATETVSTLAILQPLRMESGEEMTSAVFLKALGVAATGTGKALTGYSDGMSIVVEPMRPAAELIAEHRAQWEASVAPPRTVAT